MLGGTNVRELILHYSTVAVTPVRGPWPRSLEHYREVGRIAVMTAALLVMLDEEEDAGEEGEYG